MPFVLRQSQDEDNPRLPDAYGKQLTAGRLVYYEFDGSRTKFIVFFCRGGEFGCQGLQKMYYKGGEVPQFSSPGVANWIFHPGTVTTQISPKAFTVTTGTPGTINSAAHGYANDTPVRVRAIDSGVVSGTVPAGLSETAKYFVVNQSTNSFQLSTLVGGSALAITSAGAGSLRVWKADAGIDDPVQGSPQMFPGIGYTFSGICYVEGILPAQYNLSEEPDGFKFILDCRKVADYDSVGNIQPTPTFSANNARVAADILLQELKLPTSRIDWASWNAFKTACDTMIWSRVNEASSFTMGPGLTGKYFNRNDASVPPSFDHADLIKTRSGEEISFAWASGTSPDTGINPTWYMARWDGKLRPAYTETYTFKVTSDDGFRLWVGDVGDTDTPLIDRWTNAVHTGVTATKALTKNQLVNIRMEYFNGLGPGGVSLSWLSQSQVENIIPRSRLYPLDHPVKRYEAHLAIPGAMTAWQAFEEVMERAPGWHWQDVNGTIKFLAPNRASVHRFDYDPDAPLTPFNIAGKTFEASPRAPEERVNYQRYEFRDVESEVYAQSYIESHRTDLREQQGGAPTDTQLLKIGVMSRSLAERIAEMRMKLLTDPERQFTLRGQLDSYKVSKGDRVTLSHLLSGDKYSNPVECLVTTETTGGNADEKTYTLLPVVFPFYTDEPV